MSCPIQAVYVLVEPSGNQYARMIYLSIMALLRLHPDCRVVLVCDPLTESRLDEIAPKLRPLVQQIIVEPADMPHPRARSFYLKTRVRDLVSGDFVYLDADTLPIRPFADVFERKWDIGLVRDRNHHSPVQPAAYPFWEEPRLQKAGWQNIPLTRYFNAGILFVRDNPAARTLIKQWQTRWREMYATGDDWDQLALNIAMEDHPVDVYDMPARYNAMISVHPIHARKACIYHTFACNTDAWSNTLYDYLLHQLSVTEEIDWATMDRCVAIDHPWLPPYWPRRLWQTGNRLMAIQAYARNLLHASGPSHAQSQKTAPNANS